MSQPPSGKSFTSEGKLMEPLSLHDLANYQQIWEDLHQRTVMQIEQIKADAEKNSSANQSRKHPSSPNPGKR
jgi:hypothetical protein